MKEVKDLKKLDIISYDGYNIACFIGAKDSKVVLEAIKDSTADAAIIATKISETQNLGYTLHFVTHKNVNVKRLVSLLIEDGKKNDLYWKHNGIQGMKSARVHAANLNLLKGEH